MSYMAQAEADQFTDVHEPTYECKICFEIWQLYTQQIFMQNNAYCSWHQGIPKHLSLWNMRLILFLKLILSAALAQRHIVAIIQYFACHWLTIVINVHLTRWQWKDPSHAHYYWDIDWSYSLTSDGGLCSGSIVWLFPETQPHLLWVYGRWYDQKLISYRLHPSSSE